MTRGQAALAAALTAVPAAAPPPPAPPPPPPPPRAPPPLAPDPIRARSTVTLDPIRRYAGGIEVSGRLHERGSTAPIPLSPVRVTFDDQSDEAMTGADGSFLVRFPTTGGRHHLTVSFGGDV